MSPPSPRRIGFASTRFAGTDGVSLEAAKWAHVLEGMGHEVAWFAGESDRPPDRSCVVPEAHFTHPDVVAIGRAAFAPGPRPEQVGRAITALTDHLKSRLRSFVDTFGLDVLVAENALAIPLNLPLGIAIAELAAETGIPVIAHHHDLWWERDRFLVNNVADVLARAFPPPLPSVHHVVINSLAGTQVGLRTGASVRLVPNVVDFHRPPPEPRLGTEEVRRALGVPPHHHLVLQPTRVVQRKGIEHAVELVKRVERPATLVVSHHGHDEGPGYVRRVQEYAELLGVPLVLAGHLVAPTATAAHDGQVALDDVYRAAELVTFPSTYEGFGNALLEAVHHRRPVVVNRYSIYGVDIAPKGFRMIEMEGYVTDEVVAAARAALERPGSVEGDVDHNLALGRRHYSYRLLEAELAALLHACSGGPG